MKNKLIIVSELFYPDKASTAYIMTKIADKLSESQPVEVICGDGSYEDGSLISDSETKNYKVHRVKQIQLDKNKILSRIIRFTFSSLRLAKKLYSISNKGDKVLIVTNPAPFLVLCSFIKRIKSLDLTIIVQDVFPENSVAAGIIKSPNNIIYRILRSVFNKAYSSSDRLIVIGRDMKDLFLKKLYPHTPPMVLIENWSDPSNELEVNVTRNGPIKLLFAGNIGRCQGLESFIEIFGNVDNHKLQLELRGSGAIVSILNKCIKDNKFSNIKIGSSFTRNEQFSILKDCDIALVTLCDGMYGLGVPSKSYNIMSAGKPILYVGDPMSEIALVIKEAKIGYVFANSDIQGLKSWLTNVNEDIRSELKEMGKRAKELALTRFSEETILSKYTNLFSS